MRARGGRRRHGSIAAGTIAAVISFCALCAHLGPGEAAAEERNAAPRGKFGMSVGVQQGVGDFGVDRGVGLTTAVEAGYRLLEGERRNSLGLHWAVIWSRFFWDEPSIAGTLQLLEFDMGVRLRRTIGTTRPKYLFLGSGIGLLRSNAPIPPDSERVYFGPFLSVGGEGFVFGKFLFSVETRYGLVIGGPGSLTISLGLAAGN